MKSPALLVLATLLVASNVVWYVRSRPDNASASGPDSPSSKGAGSVTLASGAGSGTAEADKAKAGASAAAKAAWGKLYSADLATFAANLRAAGLSERLVRALITAQIDEQFRDRETALNADRPKPKFWQTDNYREPLQARLARLDLRREKAKLRTQILGVDESVIDSSGSALGDALPPAKREMVRMISEDYEAMISDVRNTGGPLLPSEIEKRKYLEAERRRELAELLSPAELADYELRTSDTVRQLKYQLREFNATEAEFRAIAALQQAFDQTRGDDGSARYGSDGWKQQQEARAALDEKIKAALGADRFTEYARARDNEFQQISRLAQRAELPPTAAVQAYGLRETASKESNRIFDDKDLSVDDKHAALKTLAVNTRSQLLSTLGPEAGTAYLKSAANWIDAIERGSSYSYTSNSTSIRGLGNTTRPSQPKPVPPKG